LEIIEADFATRDTRLKGRETDESRWRIKEWRAMKKSIKENFLDWRRFGMRRGNLEAWEGKGILTGQIEGERSFFVDRFSKTKIISQKKKRGEDEKEIWGGGNGKEKNRLEEKTWKGETMKAKEKKAFEDPQLSKTRRLARSKH